jgi:hypothetical protein
MQEKNLQWLIAAARRFHAASPDNPFLRAVTESIEFTVVPPSLARKLKDAGFAVVQDDEADAAGNVKFETSVSASRLREGLLAAGYKVSFDDADHAKYGYRVLKNGYRCAVVGPANHHPDHPKALFDRVLIAAATFQFPPPDLEAMAKKGLSEEKIDQMSECGALLHAALGFLRECQHAEDRAAGLGKRVFGLGSPAALVIKP